MCCTAVVQPIYRLFKTMLLPVNAREFNLMIEGVAIAMYSMAI